MRKLMLVVFCVFSIGCNNPISSKIDKANEETRAEIQTEITVTKDEIYAEIQELLNDESIKYQEQIDTINSYISLLITSGVRR